MINYKPLDYHSPQLGKLSALQRFTPKFAGQYREYAAPTGLFELFGRGSTKMSRLTALVGIPALMA